MTITRGSIRIKSMRNKAYGFTIVELLIVIVVIGILAAISIVAYNGISNNANDSAVRSDLNNFAKKIELIRAEDGVFPSGGGFQDVAAGPTSGNGRNFPGQTFSVSKNAYLVSNTNFVYCAEIGSSNSQPNFRITGRSKSNNTFSYSTSNGMQDLGSVTLSHSLGCSGLTPPISWSYGMYANSWNTWVN